MRKVTPYNYNLPTRPDMFYGRKQEIEMLAHYLTIPPGDSYALIGGRRMGKTSMLYALMDLFENPETDLSVLPLQIFLDMTGEGIRSTSKFFQTIGKRVHESPNFVPSGTIGTFDLTGEQPLAPQMKRILLDWDRAVMHDLGRRLRLILLLDECEQIADQVWASDLYRVLRYLLVDRNTQTLLKVVMVGSHSFLSKVRQEGSPLRNVLKYHYLHVLDLESTRQLIIEPTGGILPEEVVLAVIAQSGGHAFLTQYLMHHLWEAGLGNASAAIVENLASKFHHERNDFRDWINGLGISGARVYQALMYAGAPLNESEVRLKLSPLPPDFIQSLDALCYHGLVIKDEDSRYHVEGRMFRKWFEDNVVIQTKESVESDQCIDQHQEAGMIIQLIVEGDYVDQRGQQIHGAQTNIAGDSQGIILSGDFEEGISVDT